MIDQGDLMIPKSIKPPKTNKKEPTIERGNPLDSEIPEWLQEFRVNLVDEVPEHGDSHASSSHEVSLESTFKTSEDLGKHSVHTHFLEDRNFEICKRTKITRAPCRRRNGEAVPRAANFRDLIKAVHSRSPLDSQLLHQERATPRTPLREEGRVITSTSSRIRSRRNARRNISWVFTTGSSVMRSSART